MDFSVETKQELINKEIQAIRKEFLNNHPEKNKPDDKFNENYCEGIINFDFYPDCDSDKRILWILKEPNTNKFSPSCFAKFETFKKHKTNRTFKLIAKCSHYLINGTYTEDDKKLAEIMKHIAIINIKKTPGGEETNQKVLEVFFNKHKDLILRQIKMIEPSVVIVANEMKLLKPLLKLDSCGKENIDYINFSEKGKRQTFKFKHKLFISAYHPNARIKHRYYAGEIYKEYQKWLSEKELLPKFEFPKD